VWRASNPSDSCAVRCPACLKPAGVCVSLATAPVGMSGELDRALCLESHRGALSQTPKAETAHLATGMLRANQVSFVGRAFQRLRLVTRLHRTDAIEHRPYVYQVAPPLAS
jgi:hypothetical protein